MSPYVRYYNNKKMFYKTFATEWSAWAKGAKLSSLEAEGMSKFFKPIAKRFGLIQDFQDLGIFVQ